MTWSMKDLCYALVTSIKCLRLTVKMTEEVYISKETNVFKSSEKTVSVTHRPRRKTSERKASGPLAMPPVVRQWSTGQLLSRHLHPRTAEYMGHLAGLLS